MNNTKKWMGANCKFADFVSFDMEKLREYWNSTRPEHDTKPEAEKIPRKKRKKNHGPLPL